MGAVVLHWAAVTVHDTRICHHFLMVMVVVGVAGKTGVAMEGVVGVGRDWGMVGRMKGWIGRGMEVCRILLVVVVVCGVVC